MNYKRLFIYDVACRSDSFMFLYSAAERLKQHARQDEWRGSAGAAGKRLRSATRGFALSGRLEPEPTGTRDASKLRGALTRSPTTSWMQIPTGLVPPWRGWRWAEKPERRLENSRVWNKAGGEGFSRQSIAENQKSC
jgi:hypothetical protein